MITYNWNCKTVDVHPQEEGETDVVYNVHWIVTGVDGDYSSSVIGTQNVLLSEGGDFIPFEDFGCFFISTMTHSSTTKESITS